MLKLKGYLISENSLFACLYNYNVISNNIDMIIIIIIIIIMIIIIIIIIDLTLLNCIAKTIK